MTTIVTLNDVIFSKICVQSDHSIIWYSSILLNATGMFVQYYLCDVYHLNVACFFRVMRDKSDSCSFQHFCMKILDRF
jgi:hypothetical protein